MGKHESKSIATRLAAVTLAATLGTVAAEAATVNLTGIDGFGASSFNTAGLWDNAAAPSAGNDYVVGDNARVRTPPDGNSYTFAGDSLTINNATPYADGFMYKGTGAAGVITVDNFILDGGLISHANGPGDVFQLDGQLTIASDSRIYAKQGPIHILADISGSASITNPGSDDTGRTLWFMSSGNTFTGDIINEGRIALADDAVLNFVIGAAGVNNSISGNGPEALFEGDFVLDLTGASTTIGDSWTLVSAANASYGATFNIPGFTEVADVWSDGTYAFDESTGVLSVVPEPASLALLGLGGLMGLRRR